MAHRRHQMGRTGDFAIKPRSAPATPPASAATRPAAASRREVKISDARLAHCRLLPRASPRGNGLLRLTHAIAVWLAAKTGNSGNRRTRSLCTLSKVSPRQCASFKVPKVARQKSETNAKNTRPPGRPRRRSILRRLLAWAFAILLLGLMVLPYLLIPLYASKQVRPVSTLMLAETLRAAAMSANGWILTPLLRCWCNR
jgi:hypothetical protein